MDRKWFKIVFRSGISVILGIECDGCAEGHWLEAEEALERVYGRIASSARIDGPDSEVSKSSD